MIRIALRMLTGDGPKYAGVLFGIGVTTFLTTLFLSMLAGMLTRSYAIVTDVPWADVWVMDPACQAVTQHTNIPETSVERVRSVPGVASIARLGVGATSVRLPHGRFTPVEVIGVDDATLLGVPPSVPAEMCLKLRAPLAALADHAGTSGQLVVPVGSADNWVYGDTRFDVAVRPVAAGDEVLVNDALVRIEGVALGSARITPQPVLYTTLANATRMLPPTRNRVTFVLVKVDANADAAEVARRIEGTTGLRARTRGELKRDTVEWFIRNGEFVSHVGIMTFFAFVVGLAISGLMLFMFTREHAKVYATLKAIGASSACLGRMVAAQSMLAGGLGLAVGVGACCVVGSVLATTGFPFRLLTESLILVCVLAFAVSTLAALASLRAVYRVEAGSVFR